MVKNEIFKIIGSRQYQQQLGTMVILFVKEAQRSEVERHLVHLVQHLVQRWKGILCITLVSLHWLPR